MGNCREEWEKVPQPHHGPRRTRCSQNHPGRDLFLHDFDSLPTVEQRLGWWRTTSLSRQFKDRVVKKDKRLNVACTVYDDDDEQTAFDAVDDDELVLVVGKRKERTKKRAKKSYTKPAVPTPQSRNSQRHSSLSQPTARIPGTQRPRRPRPSNSRTAGRRPTHLQHTASIRTEKWDICTADGLFLHRFADKPW